MPKLLTVHSSIVLLPTATDTLEIGSTKFGVPEMEKIKINKNNYIINLTF